MNQLKKEFTVAFQLSSVSRYSRDHLLKPESVLEHVGFAWFMERFWPTGWKREA